MCNVIQFTSVFILDPIVQYYSFYKVCFLWGKRERLPLVIYTVAISHVPFLLWNWYDFPANEEITLCLSPSCRKAVHTYIHTCIHLQTVSLLCTHIHTYTLTLSHMDTHTHSHTQSIAHREKKLSTKHGRDLWKQKSGPFLRSGVCSLSGGLRSPI